jgi:phage gpG-like protein
VSAAIRIRIFGDEQFMFNTRALAARVANPTMALNRVSADMMRVIRFTFTGQGRRYGGSWHALSKRQIRDKARRNQDSRILIATGALMRAYTERGNAAQRLQITPSGIRLDSTLEYAEAHQMGHGVPKREFIAFAPQDHRRWADMIRDDLMSAYKGGRRR